MRPTRKKITWLAALCIYGAAVIATLMLHVNQAANGFYVTPDTAPPVDAIMILGARVYADGTLSPVLADRLAHGYTLYAAGKAKKIIVSGDHAYDGYDEVNAMLRYLLDRGVPRDDVFLDHAGLNTYDSCIRARDIFGVRSVLLCTQEFHMPRALYIAGALGLEAYGYAAPDLPGYRLVTMRLREVAAQCKAFVDCEIFRRSPAYGGDVVDINGSGTQTDG